MFTPAAIAQIDQLAAELRDEYDRYQVNTQDPTVKTALASTWMFLDRHPSIAALIAIGQTIGGEGEATPPV